MAGRGVKWCYVCNNEKPLDEFHKNASRFDGLTHRCISCSSLKRQNTRQEVLAYFKKTTLQTHLGLCVKCWSPYGDFHIDHVVPKSKSGLNDLSNYQIMCPACNVSKGNRESVDYKINKELTNCYVALTVQPPSARLLTPISLSW